MSNPLFTRTAILANGNQVPLKEAAHNLGMLQEYLAVPDSEWDVVFYLREICLGRTIEREQAQALIREKLLNADGSVDPGMRAVVLSAVRGEGRHLHIDSPFTDPLDRAIFTFFDARDKIRSLLELNEAKAVVEFDPEGQATDVLRRQKKWSKREDDRTPPLDDLPPH